MLEMTRMRAGRWEAMSHQEAAPVLEVLHLGKVLDGLTVSGTAGDWQITQPIPAELLSDGVLSFVVRDCASGTQVAHFTIVAGEPLADDLRAEIELLRAELDLLKQAFRRHCAVSEA
jgi:hypothetical protein